METSKEKLATEYSASFSLLVAGTGIEPMSRGYEPRELPLLYPAIYDYLIFLRGLVNLGGYVSYKASCELPLLHPAIYLNLLCSFKRQHIVP